MTIKIPSWLIFSVLIGLCILIFLTIRGCNQGHLTVAAADQLIKDNKRLISDSAILAHERDSTKKAYQDSLELVNGALSIKINQLLATKYQLDSADQRITKLLLEYKSRNASVWIEKANKDTSVTVPSEFVNECSQCFYELSNGQQKVKLYLSQLDSVKANAQTKLNLQEKRINQLGQQNTQLASTLQDCISISKTTEKKLAPHGQLYFSWGVLWSPYPVAGGLGFVYQNKYKLSYGVKWYYGHYGQMIETEVNMPLSLKRK